MKKLIKKILEESEWEWADQFSDEVLLLDYVNLHKIKNLADLIGLKVRISEDSEYYDIEERDEGNPINDIGEIRSTNKQLTNELSIHVHWPSIDYINSYNLEDLIIVS